MRTLLACALVCSAGCVDKEPLLTLAELPQLMFFVGTTEQPWTSADAPGESHVDIRVLVIHDYDKRTCPVLDASLTASANGRPLTEVELGGFEGDNCTNTPMVSGTFVHTADLGEDIDVVIGDRTRTVHMTFPGLLKRSTMAVVEPLGALPPAAKVRLTWSPEDLTEASVNNVETTFTQLASPYAELKMRNGYALVDGNEIRLSVPDNLTWSGPTQLAISRIDLPYVHVPCDVEVCSGVRTAAAAVTVDLD